MKKKGFHDVPEPVYEKDESEFWVSESPKDKKIVDPTDSLEETNLSAIKRMKRPLGQPALIEARVENEPQPIKTWLDKLWEERAKQDSNPKRPSNKAEPKSSIYKI